MKQKLKRTPELIADKVAKLAPRLVLVSLRLARTNGIQRGANNSLKAHAGGNPEAREIAALLHRDAMATTVIRACALLEKGDKIISYQRMYHMLKTPKVLDVLIERQKATSSGDLSDLIEHSAQNALEEFNKAYRSIVASKTKLFKRLFHFRNYYLAHIDEEKAPTQITYDELDFICDQLVAMAQCLFNFARIEMILYADEIDIYSGRTQRIMMRAMADPE